MPYVNITITRENGVTPGQKARLIKGATELLMDVLGKAPEPTVAAMGRMEYAR